MSKIRDVRNMKQAKQSVDKKLSREVKIVSLK